MPSPKAPGGPVFFRNAEEFRAWLEEHGATSSELLVGFHKVGTGKPSLTWPQSVDEALCFGWIASAKKEETRARRLAKLIESCAAGVRLLA